MSGQTVSHLLVDLGLGMCRIISRHLAEVPVDMWGYINHPLVDLLCDKTVNLHVQDLSALLEASGPEKEY